MENTSTRIAPCLWFDGQAEQAVDFYCSIFPNSRVGRVSRYDETSAQAAGQPAGSVLAIAFQLDGQDFTALNGGPLFRFNEAISLAVNCATQQEVDHYWSRLSAGGDASAQQCGWLKDRYGVSWQVVPTVLAERMSDPDPERARRATQAMLAMKKFDIAALLRAAG